MNNIFKVAVLQSKSKADELEINTQIIINHMKTALSLNADILLIPECFITGYFLPINNAQAIEDNNLYVTQLCQWAKTLKIGVVATAFTKGKFKPYNSAFVIDKNGVILMKYDKVHTCDFADEVCIQCGDEFKVCNFHGVNIGVMICYDREYPESARILMLKGAEIILVPNDCSTMIPRVQTLSTRAYENMVGVAMANPPGDNAGCSVAFSPICWDENGISTDNTLFLANEHDDKIFIADFNMDQIRDYRISEMMGNTFRKIHTYTDLLSKTINYPFLRK